MWGTFALTAALATFLLFAPGFLLLRALRLPYPFAIACAPILSFAAYCGLGILYGKVGIAANPLTVGLPPIIACGAVFLIARALLHRSEQAKPSFASVRSELAPLALYLAVGIIVGVYAFLMCLDGPASFITTYDNVFHYAQITSFINSDSWTVLEVTKYPEGHGAEHNPFEGTGGYYPAGWHIVAALLASALSVPSSLAANALNFVLMAIVFPLGVHALLTQLFPQRKDVVTAGALCALAFGAYPWVLIEVWPLIPNTASMSIMPAVATCFIRFTALKASAKQRALAGGLFLVGIACFFFLQPNSAFAVAVFLAPYCVARIGEQVDVSFSSHPRRRPIKAVFCAAAVLAIVALWCLLYKMPFLQGVINYYWPPLASVGQSIVDALGLSFAGSIAQPVLCIMVIIGVVHTFFNRQNLWLTCSYAFACIIFVVASSMGDTFIKHFLAGFWYTDPYRIAAFAAVSAIPLASLGLATVFTWLKTALGKAKNLSAKTETAAKLAVAAVFVAATFAPSLSVGDLRLTTAFGNITGASTAMNTLTDINPYDLGEMDFVNDVKAVTGDSLVINAPFDGSLFAYSISDLNEYYRVISGYAEPGETEESILIRTGLDDIETNPRVKEAVQETGAEYVLILERDTDRMKHFFVTYRPGEWDGILGVTDETPGFDVVLAQGDRRLYRIESAA